MDIYRLRHMLHDIPELSMHEVRTKAVLMDACSSLPGIEVCDRQNWFYCRYAGNTAEGHDAMAFRADFDAVCIDGGLTGHFCGHDGHSAALVGLAAALSSKKPAKDVFLIFQPAEETGTGALLCREIFDEHPEIKEIYGFHNIPGYETGTILLQDTTFACASTGMEITICGKASHAAYPENGKNPAGVIAGLILELEKYVKEPHRGMILGTVIGADIGSSAYGVSASSGILRLTLRGQYQDEYEELTSYMEKNAAAMADTAGMTCSVRYIEPFPATVNDPQSTARVERAADALGLKFCRPEEPMRWSEDFGYYLQKCRGAFFGIGAGTDHAQLHTRDYSFPDELAEIADRLYMELIAGQAAAGTYMKV